MTDKPNAPEKPKDFWDKIGVLGTVFTAAVIAAIGGVGSCVLDRSQARDTNARLYSELMSKREESESNLRKDMFNSNIQAFLKSDSGDIDSKLLNLELLAYNFHESLD